jgi:hypothetical protein
MYVRMVPSGFITSPLPVIRTSLAVHGTRVWNGRTNKDLRVIVSRELVIYAKGFIAFCMVSWPIPWSHRWQLKMLDELFLIFKTHCASIARCWKKPITVLFDKMVPLHLYRTKRVWFHACLGNWNPVPQCDKYFVDKERVVAGFSR